MPETLTCDLCVIGAGAAGLSVAAGASQMGANVVLIESGAMGGDCLNTGCVPSKALLAAGQAAADIRAASRFGISAGEPEVDFAAVHAHVHDVIAGIAPHDSVERFEGLGVRVIQAWARFTGPDRVEAGDVEVSARRFVLATGSSPVVPPIPGLTDVPYLTNETIFNLRECPAHLLIIGGGPIGLELAQAHRRLGSQVTVLEMARFLGRDDTETAALALAKLREEGVTLHEETGVAGVTADGDGITLDCGDFQVLGSHVLVATGRRADTDALGLEAAGIAFTNQGITVDKGLRTSNRRVYALGDAVGSYPFTHVAGYHAGIVLRRALFRLPAKVDTRAIPWVTYTDPEVAQVGLTEAQAHDSHSDCRVLRASFADNDRARAERRTDGLVKVVVDRRGRVLGASIAGAHAGELIQIWAMMVARKRPIRDMASLVLPYPTLSETGKRAAGEWYTASLFSERTRRLVRFLLRLG
ncbi:MAG: FAD-dependent oxidoreductase [Alphaproteobacteria bacterium]|nr:FAD-dependent oxidoreductase [Alphaproteobacteria bacterium]